MKNEHTSSTAPLLIGMAAGAALGAAGVMATNTSQRQMRRTARKIAIPFPFPHPLLSSSGGIAV